MPLTHALWNASQRTWYKELMEHHLFDSHGHQQQAEIHAGVKVPCCGWREVEVVVREEAPCTIACLQWAPCVTLEVLLGDPLLLLLLLLGPLALGPG